MKHCCFSRQSCTTVDKEVFPDLVGSVRCQENAALRNENFCRCIKQMLHIISFDEIRTIVSWAIQLSMMVAFDISTHASIYLTSKAKAEVNFTRHIALNISDLWMICLKWINLIRLRTFHLHKRFSYLASFLNYH
ncbi:hypothetical protein T10_6819 [Trichinella papuae]|uniref:Uncharacterized protein n=1 Tax=Trichinella papuae TaxID=268474 RepID=A0A0V1MYE8_9BILA|nr:hypothetical protein T10_6819 [Trichinella papuae]